MAYRLAAHMIGLCCLLAVVASPVASAANGYTQYGFGANSKAMAGVSYALPQDSLITASNPAGLAGIEDRLDFGVDWLGPRRQASIQGNRLITLASADGSYDGDEIGQFYLPEFGFRRQYNESLSYGVAVYGNGGLNTEYSENPFAAFGATGHAGIDLSQVFVAPALAWRISDRQALGLAVNLMYQQAKVYGLGVFATETFPGPYSESPNNVSDKGYDHSYGIGYRLGWLAEPFDGFMIGLSWQPETTMSRFHQYKGLIADQGQLNIPPNYGGGISYRWQDRLSLAFDVQHIEYDALKAVGTPLAPFTQGKLLGADDGPGFGWRSMTIYKFGVDYSLTRQLRVLAGYSYGRQPIPRDQTLLNILTPAIIEEHYTAGFAYNWQSISLSGYYFYAPTVTVHGKNSIPPNQLTQPLPPHSLGGGEVDLKAQGQTAGLSIGYRF